MFSEAESIQKRHVIDDCEMMRTNRPIIENYVKGLNGRAAFG